MTTPPPSGTDPSAEKPTLGEQAAADAKNSAAGIATSVATGAAAGGLAGAAIGAAKGVAVAAVKTKTGRKAIGTAVAAPLVIIMIALMAITGSGGSSAGNSMQAAYSSESFDTVLASVKDGESLGVIQDAAERTGVSWQVLAAIRESYGEKTLSSGTGPFGIDMKAAGDEITETDAKNLEASAIYVGSRLSDASKDTVYTLENYALDVGYVDAEDGSLFERVPGTGNDAVTAQEELKEQYILALEQLPLVGVKDQAENIFTTAQAWAVGNEAKADSCTPGSDTDVEIGGQTSVDLNEKQIKYAQIIINRVADRKMPEKAAIVALATTMQESTLRMWWNVKVPGSEALTDDKDAKGSDGYSVGLFQQQVNGNVYSWGTVEDAMNPNKSTDMFLDRLLTIDGWESMDVSRAAQAVQVSAFPDHYAKWETMSTQLVKDLKPTGGGYEESHEGHGEDEEDASEDTGGGNSADGAHLKVSTDVTPDLQAVEGTMKDNYGQFISSMGDYRPGGDEHTERRAVDLMIKDYKSASGISGGDSISAFLIKNAKALGVEYLIWRDEIWLGPSQGWEPYSTGGYGGMYAGNWNDTTLHNDHVHVTVYGNRGSGGDFAYVAPDGTTGGCSGGIGVGDGASLAGGDDYPYKAPGVMGFPTIDPWGMYTRECVSFVAWRLNQLMGWEKGAAYPFTSSKMGMSGDANAEAWSRNLKKKGYVTDMNPQAGAVAWWAANVTMGDLTTGPAGHVGIVKKVNGDGTVVIEQYNVTPYTYSVMTIPAKNVSGYIHVADVKAGDEKDDAKKEDADAKK